MSSIDHKITVIIPTFNRSHYLEECLNSILSQTVSANQIIVVNNGSTDQTQEICKSYANKIEYYEIGQVGKSGAVNYGFKKVTGDYIWIFDDDDVAIPDALERFLEPLKNNPDFDYSYSSIFYTATNIKNNKIGDVIRESHKPSFDRGPFIALLEGNYLGGAALFARTSCYQTVGDFDIKLLRSQDYDMAIRIARRFKGVRVSGGPTYHLRQHEGLRGPNSERFLPSQNKEKWTKYDQLIFKKLYVELPLSDYLPPEYTLSDKTRRAILQRMHIMFSRDLFLELVQDLQLLASLTDQTSFSENEYLIVRGLIFNKPSLYENIPFLDEVRRLAKSSHTIRLLRRNIVFAIGARFKNNPTFDEMRKCLDRSVRLYI